MVAEKKAEIEVTIIDRSEITTYPRLREPVQTIAVTYLAPDMPPRTIFIPKAEWTKEKELELIREDIKKYKAFKPEVVRV